MKDLTYSVLLRALLAVPAERLHDNVSIYVSHENQFYPVATTGLQTASDANDVLDTGHFYIEI